MHRQLAPNHAARRLTLIPTHQGQGGILFPYHRALAFHAIAGGAIEKGDLLVVSDWNSGSGFFTVIVRASNVSVLGVALQDAATGDTVLVAVHGQCDAKLTGTQSLVGMNYQADNAAPYNTVEYNALAKHLVGYGLTPGGTSGYPAGWVRLHLRLGYPYHTHNDLYYTEAEVDAKLLNKVSHTGSWVGDRAVYSDSLERIFESTATKNELSYLGDTHAESHLQTAAGQKMGWMDTSSGKGGYTFEGHHALYVEYKNVNALAAINEGELVTLSEAAGYRPNGHYVLTRTSASRHTAGVALETFSVGSWGKVAIFGLVDALTNDNSTAVGYYMEAEYTAGSEHKVTGGGGTWQVGQNVTTRGTTYSAGWCRLLLNIQTR